MENKKVNKETKKEFSFKEYLKNFLKFIAENLEKTTLVLIVIAILLLAVTLKFAIETVSSPDYTGYVTQASVGLFQSYGENISILLVSAFAGIVPYLYAPVVGFLGYVLSEVETYALIIKEFGFITGTLINIIPLLINILSVSVITALGIYICRTVTVGYKMSSIKNMNFLNFRIKLYEAINKPKLVEKLTKKKEEKLNKLESKKRKIEYLQILNVAVIVLVLQFISSMIQYFII